MWSPNEPCRHNEPFSELPENTSLYKAAPHPFSEEAHAPVKFSHKHFLLTFILGRSKTSHFSLEIHTHTLTISSGGRTRLSATLELMAMLNPAHRMGHRRSGVG